MTATNDPGGRRPRGLPVPPSPVPSDARAFARLQRRVRHGVLALVVGVSAACATQASAAFENTADTKEAAAASLLEALWQRDTARLERLAVSEAEFRKYVWPQLPATRAGVGGSPDYWWADLRTRSLGSMAQVVREHGGRRLELVSVSFDGTTDYATFRVHRKARVAVRDTDGNLHDLRLFGSLVETARGWKIYSYIID